MGDNSFKMSVELLLKEVGGFGLFNYFLIALTFLTTFMNGINYYSQVFMFVEPPHDDCIGTGYVRYKYNYSSIFPTLTSENNWVCEEDEKPNYVEMIFWCG